MAHKWLNRLAVETLPPQLKPFFEKHKEYLSEHAIDPDLWRKGDPAEAPRHYIDIDLYGEYPFSELPHSFEKAKEKFGKEAVSKRGIAPWVVAVRFDQLVAAMETGDEDSILLHAAALGHYVSDLHMPLHTVENYDGQLTGNDGVHSRFERRMIEKYVDSLEVVVQGAEIVAEPLAFIFDVVLGSYQLVDDLLGADTKSKKEDRDYKGPKDYDENYYASLYKNSGGMAEKQMSAAVFAIGSFWYTAWIKAGKPVLHQ